MRRGAWTTLACGAAWMMCTALARAQPTNEALAEALFREASEKIAEGRFDEACPKFAESQRLDPQLGTLLNLARCHEREGRSATAWSEYSQLVDRARRAGDDARVAYASERMTALEPVLAHLRLVVPPNVTLRKVVLDGTALGDAAWSMDLPVDPGAHEIALESAADERWTQRATALAGAHATVDVKPPVHAAPAPVVAESWVTPLRIGAIATGSVGVVVTGIGIATGLAAVSKKNIVDRECHGAACSGDGFAASQDARSLATTTTVLFVAGAVLVAAGALLFVIGGPSASPRDVAFRF